MIDVEYSSLPEPWRAELKIEVYRKGWDNGKEDVLNEWVINDEGGRKSFEITVERPGNHTGLKFFDSARTASFI